MLASAILGGFQYRVGDGSECGTAERSILVPFYRGCSRGKVLTLDGWERTQFVHEGKSGACGASLPAPGVLLTACALLPAPVNSPAGTCSQGMGTEKYPPDLPILSLSHERKTGCLLIT